jgi:glycosyltransferase involved in cell wall biosynthesis
VTDLRIAIVTYNWPPRNAIGTHRPYAWAKYWAELGANVTVITAKKYAHDAPLDLIMPSIDGVEIIEVPYGSAATRVGGRFLRSEALRRIARNVKGWLRRRTKKSIDVRGAWFTAAAPLARSVADRVDVVVSTFGPAAAHRIASDMKRHNPKIYWVADYRDLWSQSHIDMSEDESSKARQLEQSTVGENADLLTAVSEDMVLQLKSLTGKPVKLSPNGFDIEDEILQFHLGEHAKPISKPIRIVYTGMLYEGKLDPEPLLEALVELRSEEKIKNGDVTVDFYGARIDVARRLTKRVEYAPFIRLKGHVARAEALEAQQKADLLLLLGSPDPGARGVLTGKVFEYIASGTPIIGLGSKKDYEIPKLLEQTGTGISFEQHEIEPIKALIMAILRGDGGTEFYKPVLSRIQSYSRRKQALDLYAEFDL